MANVSGISGNAVESSVTVGGTGTWQRILPKTSTEKKTKFFGGFKSIPASTTSRNLFLEAQQEQMENEISLAKGITEVSQDKSANILTSKDIYIPAKKSLPEKTVTGANLIQQPIDGEDEKEDIEKDVFFSGTNLFKIKCYNFSGFLIYQPIQL